MDYEEKKLGDRVVIRSGQDFLKVMVKFPPQPYIIGTWALFAAAMAGVYLAKTGLNRLPTWGNPLLWLFACAVLIIANRRSVQETLEVSQGVLKMNLGEIVIFGDNGKYPVSEITDLALNIPDGDFYPGYRMFYGVRGGARRRVKGAISFKHRGRVWEFGTGLDRVVATYILNELNRLMPGAAVKNLDPGPEGYVIDIRSDIAGQ